MAPPDPIVVDTNVGIAANLKADVSPECALACIRALRRLTDAGQLVLDEKGLIFTEYRRYLCLSGQPGTGDAFMQWVHDHQYDPELCTRISLTPTNDGSFEEFPGGPELDGFDNSDRKFVSVSAAHLGEPMILVALDRGWLRYGAALAAVGVVVDHLCRNSV